MLAAAPGPGGLPPFGGLTVLTQARPAARPDARDPGRRGPLPVRRQAAAFRGAPVVPGPDPVVPRWAASAPLAVALCSGLARYDEVLFGAHMVQHMLLAMVAPVFLALGAPITLALRTLPKAARARLLSVLHSRVVRVISFPAIPWLLFVGSPFALYFSGWYPATLESPVLHDLLHLHFVAGRLPVLLADPGHRPRAGPGQPPVPDPHAVRDDAVPRVPGRGDHERRRRRQGPAGRRALPAADRPGRRRSSSSRSAAG